MKIVCLDGYTLNPGDFSWSAFETLGETVIYDRTNSMLPNAAKRFIEFSEDEFAKMAADEQTG